MKERQGERAKPGEAQIWKQRHQFSPYWYLTKTL